MLIRCRHRHFLGQVQQADAFELRLHCPRCHCHYLVELKNGNIRVNALNAGEDADMRLSVKPDVDPMSRSETGNTAEGVSLPFK